MAGLPEESPKKHICIGLLAHVDAGKTTLSEALLYTAGVLRRLGRVDHGNAFLDNFSLERERGITIFSKQADLSWRELEVTLLDTPGHVDFSAEMERTLQVLDYCVLVVSGADGVQSHTGTLWKLLRKYRIPVFFFVNKMDQPGADKGKLLRELQGRFGSGCVEFGSGAEAGRDAFLEELAMCSEELMEEYLGTEGLEDSSVAKAVAGREVFPCYFGSALHLEGVEELLEGLRRFTLRKEYPKDFGARVYKISRDSSGNRLTHLKVTGGVLRVKMSVNNAGSAASPEEVWEEKADSLRVYGGAGFQAVDRVEAGRVCAVTGLSRTHVGQGLGSEQGSDPPVLAPVLTYRLVLPEGVDCVRALGQLKSLEEEAPELHVMWRESSREIHVQVMGEVQTEILKSLLQERFGLEAEFADGSIMYKETIATAAEGIGHFEPLRHYAEVHLLLEPGERGSGLVFDSVCGMDELDRNWQRLILTHLEEKTHPGVLTGAPITDMKITLLTGRAHLKHTEGGDFRQATYRALRQGLMQCESVLLEPVYAFTLEVPGAQLGRAMSDVQRMHGSFEPPLTEGDMAVLTGSAPAVLLQGYQREVGAYTRGLGRFSCELKGYEPCHNAEEVIRKTGYDAERDLENPASSVFCAHGAGFLVGWDKVPEYAHVESGWSAAETSGSPAGQADVQERQNGFRGDAAGQADVQGRKSVFRRDTAGQADVQERQSGFRGGAAEPTGVPGRDPGSRTGASGRASGSRTDQTGQGRSDYITQEEIEEIFQRTYGKSVQAYEPYRYHQRNTGGGNGQGSALAEQAPAISDESRNQKPSAGDRRPQEEGFRGSAAEKKLMQEAYFLVDGYNIIFAWEDLRQLAEKNIDSARDRLMDICCNFQGYHGATLILVFDAYKIKGNPGSVQKYHNIYVVYTKEAETADQYIEKTVHKLGRKNQVTVATSDALEQMIIWGAGAVRLSARGFREEVEAAGRRLREEYPAARGLSQQIKIPEQPS